MRGKGGWVPRERRRQEHGSERDGGMEKSSWERGCRGACSSSPGTTCPFLFLTGPSFSQSLALKARADKKGGGGGGTDRKEGTMRREGRKGDRGAWLASWALQHLLGAHELELALHLGLELERLVNVAVQGLDVLREPRKGPVGRLSLSFHPTSQAEGRQGPRRDRQSLQNGEGGITGENRHKGN